MSVHNLRADLQANVTANQLTKTVTATLTDKEVMEALFVVAGHASTAVALTLPAAGTGNQAPMPSSPTASFCRPLMRLPRHYTTGGPGDSGAPEGRKATSPGCRERSDRNPG